MSIEYALDFHSFLAMPMQVLVDGYNVIFALGMVPRYVQEGDLQAARSELLKLLVESLAEIKSVTVIFDAAGAPPGAPGDFTFRGIDVRFPKRIEEADDLIEHLIARAATPQHLVVVSTDRRLRQAVERRGGQAVRSEDFLDWVARRRRQQPAQPEIDARPIPSGTEDWEKVFAEGADPSEIVDDPLERDQFFRDMTDFEQRGGIEAE